MTFCEFKINLIKNIRLYKFRFINECARKNFLKFAEFTELRKDGVFFLEVEELKFLINKIEIKVNQRIYNFILFQKDKSFN